MKSLTNSLLHVLKDATEEDIKIAKALDLSLADEDAEFF